MQHVHESRTEIPLYIINSSLTTQAQLIECNQLSSLILRFVQMLIRAVQNYSLLPCFQPKLHDSP